MTTKFNILDKDKPKKKGKDYLFQKEQEPENSAEMSEGQKVTLPEGQQVNKKGPKYNNNPEFKKTTYYINRTLEMNLQILSLQQNKDLTELVNEAIGDLLHKYGK